MTIDQIIAIIFEEGAVLGLAVLSLWILNKVWHDRLAEAKRNAESESKGADITRKALEENTKAITTLLERINER